MASSKIGLSLGRPAAGAWLVFFLELRRVSRLEDVDEAREILGK